MFASVGESDRIKKKEEEKKENLRGDSKTNEKTQIRLRVDRQAAYRAFVLLLLFFNEKRTNETENTVNRYSTAKSKINPAVCESPKFHLFFPSFFE